MRSVHCDGCKKSEPIATPHDSKDIIPVSLSMSGNLRSWERDTTQLDADLCSKCRAHLLNKYFGISPDFELGIPTFLSNIPIDMEV